MNEICRYKLFPSKSLLAEHSKSEFVNTFKIPTNDELSSQIGIQQETYNKLISILNLNKKSNIHSKYVCSFVPTSQVKLTKGSTTEEVKWLYIGQCKANTDLAEGVGLQIWSNGELYYGYYLNDEIHFQGMYIYANGNVYEGQIKKGKRNGIGEYLFPDGDKYIGEFSDNKLNGKGRYIWADGNIEEATYSFGNPLGKAHIEYTDGRKVTVDYDQNSETNSKKNKITSKRYK